jgi:Sap, sulfolipid-1-addressing protein
VFAIFVLIATLGPGVPLGIHYAMGDRSPEVLGGIREWMIGNSRAIMAVLCLVIGVKLIGDAIAGLTA